jgi:hypothetical protein
VSSLCRVTGTSNWTFCVVLRRAASCCVVLRRVVFLTLCLAVDYTIKFDTCRSSGLTAALCLQGEPAASR